METSRTEGVATAITDQLNNLFGSYKAEWLDDRLFELFTEPDYFPQLLTQSPCVLIGGRGTGKTTVLRGLSYQGQLALNSRVGGPGPEDWPYFGIYYRVDTNRVTAFQGSELSQEQWTRLFAHYLNLTLCELLVRFLEWFALRSSSPIELGGDAIARLCLALNLPIPTNGEGLGTALDRALLGFEAFINNVVDETPPALSIQGRPVEVLVSELRKLDAFTSRTFFFLVDEYENFLDYQQQVVNTLVKHSSPLYSFKIGTKELGWRVRSTLNEQEHLIHPADYVRIDLAERLSGDAFGRFARKVCNARLASLSVSDDRPPRDVREMFPGLSPEEEADRLGVAGLVQQTQALATKLLGGDRRLSNLDAYLLQSMTSSQSELAAAIVDFSKGSAGWADRSVNYRHSVLFSIQAGKRGLRKYYAGWDTFTQLAGGNIRYLLELVDFGLRRHLLTGRSIDEPVAPEEQTKAAQDVGRLNLSELEGLAVEGAQLVKLVLGLGRVFQILASDPAGHAPEVNQFYVDDEGPTKPTREIGEFAEHLLNAGVMHLALVRAAGSKPVSEGDTKAYDYMVHPIFSAFFVFSHRRKRKLLLTSQDLSGLVRSPRAIIPRIVARHGRKSPEAPPEQLDMFASYYGS